jgi:hypothetical protein
MKRSIMVSILMGLVILNVNAQELAGTYYGWFPGNAPYAESSFHFTDNTYEANIYFDDDEIPSIINKDEVVYNNGGWKYVENGTFRLINTNNIYYIEWNNSKLFSTYGIIFNELEMYLYRGNTRVFTPGIGGNIANAFPYIAKIKASSELMENTRKYYAENMINDNLLPWVEAVNGYGIGEIVTATIQVVYKDFPFNGFIISNGYVDFERPDLFKKNSRVKAIEIISPNGIKKEFTLKDTSLLQTIELPENMRQDTSRFEGYEYKIIIKDVYRGDLWEDTCINNIDIICRYYNRKK